MIFVCAMRPVPHVHLSKSSVVFLLQSNTRYPYGLPSYHLVMFKEDNHKYLLNSVLALLIVQNVCHVIFQGPVERL